MAVMKLVEFPGFDRNALERSLKRPFMRKFSRHTVDVATASFTKTEDW